MLVQVNWFRMGDRRVAHIPGRMRPYRHGDEKNSKLELGYARFKAGWGSGVRWLNGESRDVMNRVMVTQPCRIKRAGRPVAVAEREMQVWLGSSSPWRQVAG